MEMHVGYHAAIQLQSVRHIVSTGVHGARALQVICVYGSRTSELQLLFLLSSIEGEKRVSGPLYYHRLHVALVQPVSSDM